MTTFILVSLATDFTAEDYLDLIILTTHQSRSPETNPQLAFSLAEQDGFVLMQLHGMLATLLPSAGAARPLLTIWADYVAAIHTQKTSTAIVLTPCQGAVVQSASILSQ